MTKKDLNHGNVVELRNGNFYVLANVYNKFILIALTGKYHFNFDNYCKDLTHACGFEKLDIMKVYKDYTLTELLWERKETPRLTEKEKVILRNIDKTYKWIARDIDGHLYIHASKPEKGLTIWKSCGLSMIPFDYLFQFIKWEDDEPYSIEELLKGEEK